MTAAKALMLAGVWQMDGHWNERLKLVLTRSRASQPLVGRATAAVCITLVRVRLVLVIYSSVI